VPALSYAEIDSAAWVAVLDVLRDRVRTCTSLDEAANAVARGLYESFPESTALARVYALTPFGELPADIAAFVRDLARSHTGDVGAATPVLTLLGTYGSEPAWCDRKQSRGHRGIPLLSGDFVGAIPMLARLLKELGIDLSWLDDAPEVNTRRLLGGFNGIFYVDDATTARDALGRHIIPAQEFVEQHRVKTVFGMGGFYPDGTMIVCIVFTREELSRAQVERLKSLLSLLKGETFGLVRSRKIFTS